MAKDTKPKKKKGKAAAPAMSKDALKHIADISTVGGEKAFSDPGADGKLKLTAEAKERMKRELYYLAGEKTGKSLAEAFNDLMRSAINEEAREALLEIVDELRPIYAALDELAQLVPYLKTELRKP